MSATSAFTIGPFVPCTPLCKTLNTPMMYIMPSQTKWRNVGWKTSTFLLNVYKHFLIFFVTLFTLLTLLFFSWTFFYIYGYRWSPKMETLRWRRGWHVGTCFSPPVLLRQIWSFWVKPEDRNDGRPPEKNSIQGVIQDFTSGCKQEPGRVPPLPLPSLSLPSLSLPTPPLPSLPLEAGPFNSARGSGGTLLATQRGLGRSPSRNWIWCILALKYDIWWQQLYWFSTSGVSTWARGYTLRGSA